MVEPDDGASEAAPVSRLYEEAARLKAEGRLEESIAALERLVALDADHHLGQYSLAAAYAAIKRDYAKAAHHLLEVQRLKPDDTKSYQALRRVLSNLINGERVQLHLRAATLFESQGRSAEALETLSSAVGYDGSHEEARVRLARALAESGKAAEAVVHLEAVLNNSPGYESAVALLESLLPGLTGEEAASANLLLARTCMASANLEEAAVHLTAALKTSPDHAVAVAMLSDLAPRVRTQHVAKESHLVLYHAQIQRGQRGEAVRVLSALQERFAGVLSSAELARLYEEAGGPVLALRHWLTDFLSKSPSLESRERVVALSESITRFPHEAVGEIAAAAERVQAGRDWPAVVSLLGLLDRTTPLSREQRGAFVQALLETGQAVRALDQLESSLREEDPTGDALGQWEATLATLPSHQAVVRRTRVGRALMSRGRLEEARAVLLTALSAGGTSPGILYALGLADLQQGNTVSAAGHMRALLRACPGQVPAQLQLLEAAADMEPAAAAGLYEEVADLLEDACELQAAAEYLRRWRAAQPERGGVAARLGLVLCRSGQEAQAVEPLACSVESQAGGDAALSALSQALGRLPDSDARPFRERLTRVLIVRGHLIEALAQLPFLGKDASPFHLPLAEAAAKAGNWELALSQGLEAARTGTGFDEVWPLIRQSVEACESGTRALRRQEVVEFLVETGRSELASQQLRAWVIEAPKEADTLREMARLARATKASEEALSLLAEIVRLDPNAPEFNEFIELLKASPIPIGDAEGRQLARELTDRGDCHHALQLLGFLSDRSPEDVELVQWRGELHERLGERSAAMECHFAYAEATGNVAWTAERLAVLAPQLPAQEQRRFRLEMAERLCRAGEHQQAREHLAGLAGEVLYDPALTRRLAFEEEHVGNVEGACDEWLSVFRLGAHDEEAKASLLRLAPLLPERAQKALHEEAGQILLEAEDSAGAAPHLNACIRLEPTDLDAYARAAVCAERRGDLTGAADYWRSAVETDPADERTFRELQRVFGLLEAASAKGTQPLREAREHLAEVFGKTGQWDQCLWAVQILEPSEAARLHVGLAHWHVAEGTLDTAVAHAVEAFRLGADNRAMLDFLEEQIPRCGKERQREIRVQLFDLCLARHKVEAARAQVAELALLLPRDVESQRRLAGMYQRLGDSVSAAERLAAALRLNPEQEGTYTSFLHIVGRADRRPFERVLAEIGELYLSRKQFDRAVQLLRLLATYRPHDEQLHLKIAGAFQALGDRPRALEHFEQALAANPSSGTTLEEVRSLAMGLPREEVEALHLRLAELFIRSRRPELAAEELRFVSEMNPDDEKLLVRLAGLYEDLGQIRQAVELQVRALRLHPMNLEARRHILSLLDQMPEADAKRVHFDLSALFSSANNPAAAAEHLQILIKRDPSDLEARRRAAAAFAQVGDYVEAAEHLLVALRESSAAPVDLETLESLLPQLPGERVAVMRRTVADLLLDRNRASEAIAHLKALAELGEESPSLHLKLAQAHAALGDQRVESRHLLSALRLDPSSAESLRRLLMAARKLNAKERLRLLERAGETLEGAGLVGPALEARAETVKTAPNDRRAHIRLLELMSRCGDKERLTRCLELGTFLLEHASLERAAEVFEALIGRVTAAELPLIGAAAARQKAGELSKAVDHLLAALALQPDHEEVNRRLSDLLPKLAPRECEQGHLRMAAAFAEEGQYERACDVVSSGLALTPGSEELQIQEALYRSKLGDTAGARAALLRAFRRFPAHSEIYGMLQESMRDLSTRETLDLRLEMAGVFDLAELYPQAIAELEMSLGLSYQEPLRRRLFDQHVRYGDALLKRSDVRGARQQFEMALTYDPGDYGANLRLAEILLETHRDHPDGEVLDTAERHLQESSRAHPDRLAQCEPLLAELYLLRGQFWSARKYFEIGEEHLARGQYDQAIESYAKAFGRGLTWPLLSLHLAVSYREKGDLDTARSVIDDAVRRDSDFKRLPASQYADALDALGHAYFDKQKYEDAKRTFERVLELEPQRKQTRSFVEYSRLWGRELPGEGASGIR